MSVVDFTLYDSYTWRARIFPSFVVILPVVSTCMLWVQFLDTISRWVLMPVLLIGLVMLLAQIGRDRGYRKQPELWKKWGGAPTIQILRHRTVGTNTFDLQRWHQKIRIKFPEIKIPFEEEEKAFPGKADEAYEAAAKAIIRSTREKEKFPLLFEENVNYGYRRNLWGLKPIGVTFSAICLLIVVIVAGKTWLSLGSLYFSLSLTILWDLLILSWWIYWVNDSWVRIPAGEYAQRLMEALDQL